MPRIFRPAGLALAWLCASCTGAIGQTLPEPVTYQVPLSPLMEFVVWPAVSVVATYLAGWLSVRVCGWLKISQDAVVRGYLETALQNAIAYGRSRVDARGPLSFNTRNEIVAAAATFAVQQVPDALKRFGIDEAGLQRLLRARLEAQTPTEEAKQ